MFTHILSRWDTSANLTANNPILLEKEICIETDTNKMKIWNWVDAYNTLAYFGSTWGWANPRALFQEQAPILSFWYDISSANTKRWINTEVYNNITWASLNWPGNSIILPAWTYFIEWFWVTRTSTDACWFNAIWWVTQNPDFDAPLIQWTNMNNNDPLSSLEQVWHVSWVVILAAETEIALYYRVTQSPAPTYPLVWRLGMSRLAWPWVNLYSSLYIEKIA